MTAKRQTPAMLIKKELKKAFPWVKYFKTIHFHEVTRLESTGGDDH